MDLVVYHNEKFLDFEKYDYKDTDTVYLPKEDFQAVGVLINSEMVEDAFVHTQNLDRVWTENPRVTPYRNKPFTKSFRSTSIGDVVKAFYSEGIDYFIVMPDGWKKFKFLTDKDQACWILEHEIDNLNKMNFRTIIKYVGTKYLMEK